MGTRIVTLVVVALAALSMVIGSALAGTSKGGGGDSGNKNGTVNKNATSQCNKGYSLVLASDYSASAYDLNGNTWVCETWLNPGYNFTDDIRN